MEPVSLNELVTWLGALANWIYGFSGPPLASAPIARLQALLADGTLTRFGPLFDAEKLGGAFTLAAMQVPAVSATTLGHDSRSSVFRMPPSSSGLCGGRGRSCGGGVGWTGGNSATAISDMRISPGAI